MGNCCETQPISVEESKGLLQDTYKVHNPSQSNIDVPPKTKGKYTEDAVHSEEANAIDSNDSHRKSKEVEGEPQDSNALEAGAVQKVCCEKQRGEDLPQAQCRHPEGLVSSDEVVLEDRAPSLQRAECAPVGSVTEASSTGQGLDVQVGNYNGTALEMVTKPKELSCAMFPDCKEKSVELEERNAINDAKKESKIGLGTESVDLDQEISVPSSNSDIKRPRFSEEVVRNKRDSQESLAEGSAPEVVLINEVSSLDDIGQDVSVEIEEDEQDKSTQQMTEEDTACSAEMELEGQAETEKSLTEQLPSSSTEAEQVKDESRTAEEDINSSDVDLYRAEEEIEESKLERTDARCKDELTGMYFRFFHWKLKAICGLFCVKNRCFLNFF